MTDQDTVTPPIRSQAKANLPSATAPAPVPSLPSTPSSFNTFSRKYITIKNSPSPQQPQQPTHNFFKKEPVDLHPSLIPKQSYFSLEPGFAGGQGGLYELYGEGSGEMSRIYEKGEQLEFGEEWEKEEGGSCFKFEEFRCGDDDEDICYEKSEGESTTMYSLSQHSFLPDLQTPPPTTLSLLASPANTQYVNLLISKNSQKSLLSKKIFDLEFQLFTQKKQTSRVLSSLIQDLKSRQQLCQQQDLQIKRLEKQVKKVDILEKAVKKLQEECVALRSQLPQPPPHEQPCEASTSDTNDDDDDDDDEDCQVTYLESVISEYEKELLEMKKKAKEQKKVIAGLESQVHELEGVGFSLEVVNGMLAEVNEEIVRERVRAVESRCREEWGDGEGYEMEMEEQKQEKALAEGRTC